MYCYEPTSVHAIFSSSDSLLLLSLLVLLLLLLLLLLLVLALLLLYAPLWNVLRRPINTGPDELWMNCVLLVILSAIVSHCRAATVLAVTTAVAVLVGFGCCRTVGPWVFHSTPGGSPMVTDSRLLHTDGALAQHKVEHALATSITDASAAHPVSSSGTLSHLLWHPPSARPSTEARALLSFVRLGEAITFHGRLPQPSSVTLRYTLLTLSPCFAPPPSPSRLAVDMLLVVVLVLLLLLYAPLWNILRRPINTGPNELCSPRYASSHRQALPRCHCPRSHHRRGCSRRVRLLQDSIEHLI